MGLRFGHLAIVAAVSPLAAWTSTGAAAFSVGDGAGVSTTSKRNHHGAAFVVSVSPPPAAFSSSSSSSSDLRMSDSDNTGDDWYSDFDPQEYGRYNDEDDDGWGGGGYNDRGGGGYGRGGGGGYGRRGGRNRGGRSGYTRDTSRDNSEVDVEAVESLLSERSDAKRRRDYDTADSIRDQLLQEFRVGVYDKDRTWRTGASTSGSRMRFRDGGGGRGGDRRGGGGGRGGMRRERDFGPNGHDYERSVDAGEHTSPLDESEIHAMIAERLQAKLDRNFDVADAIQYDLVDAGVFIHDKTKEWRSDGVPFGDLEGGRGGGGGNRNGDRNRPYCQSAYSDDLDDPDLESRIEDMVARRTRCKMNRDYSEADGIRDELADRYDVYIDDRVREWSVGGDFGERANRKRAMSASMQNRGYVKSEASADLPAAEDEAYVREKIDERADAKGNRDYSLADGIRDELRAEYDVHIDDRARMWSVGGDFGGGKGRRAPSRDGGYVCRGRGALSDEDLVIVESMLAERTDAKRDRDFDSADAIRDELRNTYDVAVDDRKREWRVDSDEYVQLPPEDGAVPLEPTDAAFVEARLSERFALKRDRKYDEADAIRDELGREFGVYIDDRNKQWRVERRGEDATGGALGEGEYDDDDADDSSSFAADEELDGDLDSIFEADEDETAFDTASEAEEEELSETQGVSSPDVVSMDDLSSLTVVQLKEKLREAGKPVSGRKGELIERLLA